MIPKAKRLTRADFGKRPLRRVVFPFGSITVFGDTSKAAVVVSKKICPNAVSRNKLRRRIYAILRPVLSGGSPYSIIVYPNKKASSAPFLELRVALLAALQGC
ncbi:MAG: ribonuclease P protein component [bacterium]|nr:ribonuclease P protein component [bacterium]